MLGRRKGWRIKGNIWTTFKKWNSVMHRRVQLMYGHAVSVWSTFTRDFDAYDHAFAHPGI